MSSEEIARATKSVLQPARRKRNPYRLIGNIFGDVLLGLGALLAIGMLVYAVWGGIIKYGWGMIGIAVLLLAAFGLVALVVWIVEAIGKAWNRAASRWDERNR